MGWLVAAVGYYGPWIAHATAALTLSGADMGEFVKFLPGILDGTQSIARQLFYLPPFAVAVSVAMLIGSYRLQFPWFLRFPVLCLAFLASLQLLPPAWSPSSLLTAEFRLQTVALCVCWLLLACHWLLGRLKLRWTASVSAAISLVSVALCVWQFFLAKPEIDKVYGNAVQVGWGFYLCMAGLPIIVIGSLVPVLRAQRRRRESWPGA